MHLCIVFAQNTADESVKVIVQFCCHVQEGKTSHCCLHLLQLRQISKCKWFSSHTFPLLLTRYSLPLDSISASWSCCQMNPDTITNYFCEKNSGLSRMAITLQCCNTPVKGLLLLPMAQWPYCVWTMYYTFKMNWQLFSYGIN